jgi:abhydrolase domain-containing protein 6
VIVAVYYIFPGASFKFLLKTERSIAGLKQNNITIEGFNIQYLEGGQGDVILFLHGFGANKDNWTRFSKYLTPHFRVIAPDLPGFGESTRDAAASYTISVQADRIHAFANALGLKAFHLGGNSMGGNGENKIVSYILQELKFLDRSCRMRKLKLSKIWAICR